MQYAQYRCRIISVICELPTNNAISYMDIRNKAKKRMNLLRDVRGNNAISYMDIRINKECTRPDNGVNI